MDLDPERCYRAVLAHDRRFDGRFFTGVVTTGIYCRPICPVSPPKFENVRYYPCAAAAEEAGFRPCRRCRPETAPGTPAWVGTSATVARALRLITDGALDAADVERLGARLGVGGRHLRRLFATYVGASPRAIARTRRVHFARRLIDESTLPMTEVSLSAGFRSVRQFNHAIRACFGRTPTTLRRAARAKPAAPADGGTLLLRLPYRPPLAWAALARYLAARATPGVEAVDATSYRRTVELDGVAGRIEVRFVPDQAHLLLRLDLPSTKSAMPAVDRVRRLFDLDADPLEIASHLRRDRRLVRGLRRLPGLRIPGAWDGFELAVRAILGQQVTVAGATTLAGRLARVFGTPLPGAEAPSLLFPRPEVLATADVARIGIPRARADAIRALAAAVAGGALRLDPAADPEATVARLTAIPGIGAWTAAYIALRALGEPDAFPAGDLGLRRALGNGRGPLAPGELARAAEAWRPWRGYAAMSLWLNGEPDHV
jgi:AraC family transcriptional regulator, regulatory protein of adaptative response / DNA-3-methyladenine glycosylase II